MPITFVFDITDKCVKFMQESIKDMPGNPGQEVLVEELNYDCRFLLRVDDERPTDFDITCEYDINLTSNHPEAIEIIMGKAEEYGEMIARQAEEPGPWRLQDAVATGNWKIVGLDSEWGYDPLIFFGIT